MIPPETVNLILDTARVEDVVGDYVTLKRRGANLIACCPFHNEKTPSFYVSPSKGIFKCFGCGKGGTAVGFIMEYEHLSYVEALRHLARKYGIEIVEKEESAEDIARRQKNESLLIVSEFAGKFYKEQLKTSEGYNVGYQYFKSRGLTDETIEEYGLGWAPTGRNIFAKAATKKGYKEEYLLDTGLCVKYEDGVLKDRFFDRVMFPIHSISGKVIAFGGRTLHKDKKIAKYVNSHESEIYVKRKSLYGLHFAKNAISKADKTILVEGYLDVLSMHQKGIKNVVASSGTSLTEEQIRLIKRYSDNVTIMYDGDSAGIHAALRGVDMILKEGMNVRIIQLPEKDDPDSFAQAHTKEEIEQYISENEKDFVNFKAELLYSEAKDDPIKRAELINSIADTIADIPDAVKRSVYVQFCSEKFKVESEILFSRITTKRAEERERLYWQKKREKERAEREAEQAKNKVASKSYGNYGPQDYSQNYPPGMPPEMLPPGMPPDMMPPEMMSAGMSPDMMPPEMPYGMMPSEMSPEMMPQGTSPGMASGMVSSGMSPSGMAPLGMQSNEQTNITGVSGEELWNTVERNRDLGPSERELLEFILNYGTNKLVFPKDSPLYVPGEAPASVADFIDSALASDDVEFKNDAYSKVYDLYYEEYYKGTSQDDIIRNMLNSSDRQIAYIVTHLTVEKYMLTIKNFAESLMTRDSWLVKYVPKSVLVYKNKRLQIKRKLKMFNLQSKEISEEKLMEILNEIKDIDKAIKVIKLKLGREHED